MVVIRRDVYQTMSLSALSFSLPAQLPLKSLLYILNLVLHAVHDCVNLRIHCIHAQCR